MASKLNPELREALIKTHGPGTHYCYQGNARVYSGPPANPVKEDFPTWGVGIEDYAKGMARTLEEAAFFEVTVLASKCRKGHDYISKIKQLPIPRR